MNRNFSLLVKPASYCCNLRCASCFYLGKNEMFGNGALRMDDSVLSSMIRKFMTLGLPVSSFGWQGGECTLMGIEFFRKALLLQREFAKQGQQISNSIQTNATLLDDDWGRFLHANKFLAGISIDGPQAVHDISRSWPDGRGSYRDALRGMEILKRHKVEFNVLTLVSAVNQDYPLEIYRHLKSLGVNYHQYIECVEFDPAGNLKPCSVDAVKWGNFLCSIFDEWYETDIRTVSIRLFDSIIARIVDGSVNLCSMGADCRQYFVIEHNGDIYPCDFYVTPEWKLGNVISDGLMEVFNSPRYSEFGARKRSMNGKCAECEYLGLCMGCCPKNRFPNGNAEKISALCEGWKIFYSHTLERFRKIAGDIVRERMNRTRGRIGGAALPGRNDLCPCGSGKKYKNCCG